MRLCTVSRFPPMFSEGVISQSFLLLTWLLYLPQLCKLINWVERINWLNLTESVNPIILINWANQKNLYKTDCYDACRNWCIGEHVRYWAYCCCCRSNSASGAAESAWLATVSLSTRKKHCKSVKIPSLTSQYQSLFCSLSFSFFF